jgi:hypothetical protein
MTTPNERLVRMRKSFANDRSVLTEDYKYFTTPNKAAKQLAKQPAQKHTKCRALVRLSRERFSFLREERDE